MFGLRKQRKEHEARLQVQHDILNSLNESILLSKKAIENRKLISYMNNSIRTS